MMLIKILFQQKYLLYWLLAGWLVFQAVQLDGHWTRMDDDAHYILHAQSMLISHSYNDPHFVYADDVDYIPKNASPGWPLLLVPFLYLFGKDLLILKMVVILLGLVSGIVLFQMMQRRSQDFWLGFLVTGIYYFSMTTIVFSKVIYSEWPYLLLSFVIIYRHIGKHEKQLKTGSLVLTGILLGILLLFRFVAVALILAVVCGMVFKHIRHAKMFPILRSVVLLLVISFSFYQAVLFAVRPEAGPGYKEQFLSKNLYYQEDGQATLTDIVNRVPENGKAFIQRVPNVVFGRSWYEYASYRYPVLKKYIDPLLIFLGVVITLLILIGFFKQSMDNISVIEYYVLFYMAIMMVIWFHYEVYRYLMPVAIFLVYYMVIGISVIVYKIFKNKKLCRAVVFISLSSVLVINIFHAAIEIYRYQFSPQSEKVTFVSNGSTVEWLKENVKQNEIIIADDPRWYALETDLSVTPSPVFRDIEKVYQHIQQFPSSIVVIDHSRDRQRLCMVPVLQKYSNHFDLLKEFGDIQIYRFVL